MVYETYDASKILSLVLYTVLLRRSVHNITFSPMEMAKTSPFFFLV